MKLQLPSHSWPYPYSQSCLQPPRPCAFLYLCPAMADIHNCVIRDTFQSFYALLSKLSPNKISQSLKQFFRNNRTCLADLILTQLLISTWMLLHLLLYHYQGCAPSLESSSVHPMLWIPSRWCRWLTPHGGDRVRLPTEFPETWQEASYKPWACSFPVPLLYWILAPKTLFDPCVHEP